MFKKIIFGTAFVKSCQLFQSHETKFFFVQLVYYIISANLLSWLSVFRRCLFKDAAFSLVSSV